MAAGKNNRYAVKQADMIFGKGRDGICLFLIIVVIIHF